MGCCHSSGRQAVSYHHASCHSTTGAASLLLGLASVDSHQSEQMQLPPMRSPSRNAPAPQSSSRTTLFVHLTADGRRIDVDPHPSSPEASKLHYFSLGQVIVPHEALDDRVTYPELCLQLGRCILHQLRCQVGTGMYGPTGASGYRYAGVTPGHTR